MKSNIAIKDKIILLFILSLAAGFIFLLPQGSIEKKKLSENTTKQKLKTDNNNTNCERANNSDLSAIMENQRLKTQKSCLYIGCSGTNF